MKSFAKYFKVTILYLDTDVQINENNTINLINNFNFLKSGVTVEDNTDGYFELRLI